MDTLQFAGRSWSVKTGFGGPGPCHWDASNAWVDDQGQVHLRTSQSADTWQCAEIMSTEEFRFGRFQWWVTARVDQFDPNIVLGLFPYLGPDGQNEIDIEMARWGDPGNPPGNFTVWPASADGERTYKFPVELTGTHTTHRIEWRPNAVHFAMLNGHRHDDDNVIERWTYEPREYDPQIPHKRMRVHMNLWLFRGLPPTDKQPLEVVISGFDYQALSA